MIKLPKPHKAKLFHIFIKNTIFLQKKSLTTKTLQYNSIKRSKKKYKINNHHRGKKSTRKNASLDQLLIRDLIIFAFFTDSDKDRIAATTTNRNNK